MAALVAAIYATTVVAKMAGTTPAMTSRAADYSPEGPHPRLVS
jgi:hypothetical protein